MKVLSTAVLAGTMLIVPTLVMADPPNTPPGQRAGGSLGEITREAIANGFDQGQHASDPSGDGHGPGDADQPRSGLANVVERGNLSATLDAIDP